MAKQPHKKASSSAAAAKSAAATKGTRTAPAKAKPASPAAPRAGGTLTEGAKAPDFTLPRDGGGSVSLADFAGRKLVIFFYPRAGTSGCTREAVDFSRLAPDFDKAQTALLGVSGDPPAAQDKFRDKYRLRTPLASDEEHAMLLAYGVWGEKSLYGKRFEGITRTTVLIDRDGRVERIWSKVKVDGHAEAVLEAAKSQA